MNDSPPTDAGFSLIEVIVAMMLLGILATVTLPFFITGIRVTADDSATTTATARVGALIEQARTAPTCSKLRALASDNQSAPFTDAHGRPLKLTMDPPDCVEGTPAAVTVAVRATNDAGTSTLSSASTIIYVTS